MFIPKLPKLEIGKAYFMCAYYLRDLPTPEIETWIYIGTNIFPDDQTEEQSHHYFEGPESYFAKEILQENAKYRSQEESIEQPDCEPQQKLRVGDSDLEGLVYDYQGLREWVIALAEEPNVDQAF